MRRLALVPVVLIVTLVVALPAGASPARREVGFTLTWETCPNLATGTILEGEGTESSITIERTVGGVTTTINATHTHGTTIDQDGNEYVNTTGLQDEGQGSSFMPPYDYELYAPASIKTSVMSNAGPL